MKQTNNHNWYELSSLCVISIFIMIFGEAYGRSVIGGAYRIITGGISALFLFLYFINKRKKMDVFDMTAFRYVVVAIFLLLISAPFWSTFYNSYSYVGILVAFLVYYINPDRALKLILFVTVLCVFLEFYEYLTQSYLFEVSLKDIEMDEKELGGNIGVFRARGIFFGPLNAGSFMVFASLLFYKRNWVLYMAFLGCFFANSRTGMVLLAFLFVAKLLSGKINKRQLMILTVLLLFFLPPLLLNEQVQLSLLRLGQTGADSAQDTRLFYWTSAITMYLNYPIHSLLVGDNGLFNATFDNNPESGWISLLVDNGIVGFFFYFLPIIYCGMRFLFKKDYSYLIIIVVLLTVNFVITAHLSGSNSLLYWLLMFELTNKAIHGINKHDLIELKSEKIISPIIT